MTAPPGRPTRGRRLASWPQWGGAAVAVAASLAALSLPGAARAATTPTYDQMTGVGPTASAVTAQWTSGLLDNTNSSTNTAALATANTDRTNKSSPLWFMYQQFQGLTLTVSQTQDIGHQGITVGWTWTNAATGKPVQTLYGSGGVTDYYLQMMECYGDAATGPTPQQCEYGSTGLLPSGANSIVGQRDGLLCSSSTPSTSNPPGGKDGSSAADGCDPAEPSGPDTAPCPGAECNATGFTVPFAPVSDPTSLDYTPFDTTYYNEFNTDEVQEAVTDSSGAGSQQFETLTGIQASGLGCGLAETDNSPRGCWLVIVPRGEYSPNGFDNVTSSGIAFPQNSSPLSATNWAMRIQIHLAFSPVGSFCPPGTNEVETVGTQLVARAMQSWQLKLNQNANCNTIYGYSAVPEATSTQQLEGVSGGGTAGLAFTTIPIGSEATRDGGSAPTGLPPILYAPVAVTALDFGFHISVGQSGSVTTPVKLTPLLVSKAVTQSYIQDLPDYYPSVLTATGAPKYPGPTWAQGGALNISADPTFAKLNPEVPSYSTGPLAPLLTEDHSAFNQQIWQWIQSSSAATTWLGGAKDSNDLNMVVDPYYGPPSSAIPGALNLGKAPAIDSFPRAYSPCLDLGLFAGPPQKEETKCSLDLLPYTDNYDSAAAAVLSATDSDETGQWSGLNLAPDGTLGWWSKAGVEPIGQIWMWAADDTADLAAYGIVPASLCDDAGTTCVSPTSAAVTSAVTSATPDSAGLLEVNPASPGSGAYPLTQVIYAAVATDQSATALSQDASLISFAAGTGQTTGTAAGDLPPGYLPLPSSLQAQAQSVVTHLQALASPSPTTSMSTSASSTSTSTSTSTTSSTSTTTSTTSSSTSAASTSTGSSSTTAAAAGATPTPAPAAAATQPLVTTPPPALGKVPPVTSGTHPTATPSIAIAPGGYVTSLPPAAPAAAGVTPTQAVGDVRWALIAIAIVGGAFAGGGTWLRSGTLLPWRRRPLGRWPE